MGGCVASKLEEEEEVVSICRERKRLLKLAVDRRYALADAHCRYFQSLYGVSAAIRLFVARHSSPSSPFLITFPPPSPPKENVVSNPLFLQQTPSEPTQKAIDCESCDSSTSSYSSEEERVEKINRQEEQVCGGYFYMEMPPQMPSPQRDFGWDFFNPFAGVRPEIISGYNRRISDDDLRVIREQEGIPDLEEEGEKIEEENKVEVVGEEREKAEHEEKGVEVVRAGDGVNVSQGEQKGSLTVVDIDIDTDTPMKGRELLEALKDIEDHFIRACDSGKDVSKMLEANRVHLQSGLEEIKDTLTNLVIDAENSTKLMQAITWRSTSSRSFSSCKSLVAASSSKSSSSTWTEFKNDLFDDYGGMSSGSHTLTLGRLYAWEKKLYEEVKAGDNTRKIYERKCNQLNNQDARGDEGLAVDKTRAVVKDLYSRILVTIRSAESISTRIETLRDEELQPQIIELLQGLMRTWKIMSESHEIQNKIMFDVKCYTCPTYGKFCNNSHRLATLQLEAELQNWRTCFTEYMATQKAYIEALHGWLSKFVVPDVKFSSRGRTLSPPVIGPPLLVICHDWLASIEKLPVKAVSFSLKSFGKDMRALWVQQGEEQRQKRKVESLGKELDRRILTFQKAENRIFESKLSDHNTEPDMENHTEILREKKDSLDIFRGKVDFEKEKHCNCTQETQRITLNGFQTGFCGVFESLTEFSKASFKMYNDLVSYNENSEKAGKPEHIEGSQTEEDGSRR